MARSTLKLFSTWNESCCRVNATLELGSGTEHRYGQCEAEPIGVSYLLHCTAHCKQHSVRRFTTGFFSWCWCRSKGFYSLRGSVSAHALPCLSSVSFAPTWASTCANHSTLVNAFFLIISSHLFIRFWLCRKTVIVSLRWCDIMLWRLRSLLLRWWASQNFW